MKALWLTTYMAGANMLLLLYVEKVFDRMVTKGE
jgi:hypothetical protein